MDLEANKTQSIFRQALINTLSNYGGKTVILGVWFFLTPYILSQIGPRDYGMWILVGSLVTYGSLLDFGIANAVTKYVAEYQAKGEFGQASSLIATALWVYTIIGLAAILLGAILAPIMPYLFNVPVDQHGTFSWLVFLSGIGLGVSLLGAAPIAVLKGLHRFDVINMISICGMVLLAGFTVLALHWGGGALGLAAVSILVNLVMMIPAVWLVRRYGGKIRFGWSGANRSYIRTVAGYSSALFLINMSGQLKAKTDEIVVGAFLTVGFVTPYSIAHRLSDIPQMITDQFMKVIMPLASKLHSENDRGRLRQLYITSTRLTLASFLPLGIGITILAKPFLTAWVGKIYAPYSGLVLILICASLFDTLMWPANAIMQGMARHRLLAFWAIASGVLNLAISIALVRSLGLAGVALGTLIPTTLECLFFVIPYSMRVIGIDLRTALKEIYLPVIAPSILMGIVLIGLRYLVNPVTLISILAVGSVGLLVYIMTFFSTGASSQERNLFLDMLRNTLQSIRLFLQPRHSDAK